MTLVSQQPYAVAAVAALLSLGLSLSPVLGGAIALLAYLAPLPLLIAGILIPLPRLLPALALGLILAGVVATPILTLFYVFMVALPVVLVSAIHQQPRLAKTASANSVTALVYYAVACLLAVVVFYSGETSFNSQITTLAQTVLTENGMLVDVPSDVLTQVQFFLSNFLPAILATGWLVIMLLNITIADRVSARLKPTPHRFSLRPLNLPPAMLGILCVAALLSLAPDDTGYSALNVLAILCVPYALVGLAVLHTLAPLTNNKNLILILVYTCLLLIIWTIPLLALVGVAEHFTKWQQRFGRTTIGA